jgi:PAS domain S-box-containing protein
MPPTLPLAGLPLFMLLVAGGVKLRRFVLQARSDRLYREAGLARERAWDGLLKSLNVQTLVLAHSGLGIAHIKGRRIQWANPRWAEIFGVTPEQCAGTSTASIHVDQAGYEAFGRSAYATVERDGHYASDVRLRRVDGSPFWGFMVGSLLVPGVPEEGAIWCLEDVSARVEAQQELDDTLRLNQKLIASSPTGILLYRASDGACILANEAAARTLGSGGEDLLGQDFRRIPAWVEAGILARAEAALGTGAEQALETTLALASGREIGLACTFVPFESRGEQILLLLVTDISARKRSEREREQLMMELEQKNKELETLVHVASHDLRSPLVNIQGFSQRLGRSLEELKRLLEAGGSPDDLNRAAQPLLTERMPAALEYIRASGVKMDAIINGLLRLSRAGRMVLRSERLDMDQLLETAASAMAFQLQEAEGALQLEPLPPCKADPVQTAQVFSNLLDNAIKYRRPGEPLRIRVSGRTQHGLVVYCVEDNGIGISLEHRGRIFDIFQRLAPLGPTKGDGLGLTLVRRMVERNGGRIWVESAPGAGSRFLVELPTV